MSVTPSSSQIFYCIAVNSYTNTQYSSFSVAASRLLMPLLCFGTPQYNSCTSFYIYVSGTFHTNGCVGLFRPYDFNEFIYYDVCNK